MPKLRPIAGHANLGRHRHLSVSDLEEIFAARAILAPQQFYGELPAWVCLQCAPAWSEMHHLSLQDCQLQAAKEDVYPPPGTRRGPVKA